MLGAILGSFVGAVIGSALACRASADSGGEKAVDRGRGKDCGRWISESGRHVDPESARVMCPVYHDIARWNLDQYYKYVTYCGGAIGGVLAWAVAAFVKHHSDPASGFLALVFLLAWWLQSNVSKLLGKQYKRWLENLVLAAKCEYIMGLHGAVRPPAEERADERPWPKDETFQVQSFYRDRTSCCWRTSRKYVCEKLKERGNLLDVGQRTLWWLAMGAAVFVLLVGVNLLLMWKTGAY